MSTYFTCTIVDRPNIAGLVLMIIAMSRYLFALGYKSSDIGQRFPFFLLSQFAQSIGLGYATLVALSMVHVGPFVVSKNTNN